MAATGAVLLDLVEGGRDADSTALAKQYLHLDDAAAGDPPAVLASLARDHQHEPVRLIEPR